jgi:hypothetical protein
MKNFYAAGFNQPGYMPETDSVHFDDFDEAKGYVENELEGALEDSFVSGLTHEQREFETAINEVRDWREIGSIRYWQVYADDYVYWINAITEDDYDPEE